MAKVIACCGFRLSGKTLLCQLIKELAFEHGIDATILSFATPLKEEFCKFKGFSLDHLAANKEIYREDIESYSLKMKQDHNDPEYFTKLLLRKIYPNGTFLIDDMRLMDEEALPLMQMGAIIYRVYADKETRIERGMIPNKEVDKSRFETELDLPRELFKKVFGTNFIPNNSNSVSDLYIEARILLERHLL